MKRICIIKLGAMGDVLRTTCILPGLWKKYRQPEIVWITKKESIPLLRHNEYISKVLSIDGGFLGLSRFDLIISLDDEQQACALSSNTPAGERFGSYLDPVGICTYSSTSAQWFKMGLLGSDNRDELKMANTVSYPKLLYKMLGLAGPVSRPILNLTKGELQIGEKILTKKKGWRYVGLNTGAGGRWELKKLSKKKTVKLAKMLSEIPETKVVLLGGPEENQRNKKIKTLAGKQIKSCRTNLRIREFAGVIANLDVLVVSDSLALHIALALSIPVVVFIGPTSSAEIELYGSGIKVLPTGKFSCFYDRTCAHRPKCERYMKVLPLYRAAKKILIQLI